MADETFKTTVTSVLDDDLAETVRVPSGVSLGRREEEALVQLVAENVLRACFLTTDRAVHVVPLFAALAVTAKSCGLSSSDLHAALAKAIRLAEAS
jgi:hypothetical protein